MLVTTAQKADAKAGTEKFGAGEELVTTAPFSGEGKGKPISVFRVRRGRPATIGDGNLTLLALPTDKQTLSFRGRPIGDDQILWNLGVRQDDTINLEFASPTMPQKLQIVRAPDKPKGEKKGKGGKGGKGGKKKK